MTATDETMEPHASTRADLMIAFMTYIREKAVDDYIAGEKATAALADVAVESLRDDPALDGLRYELEGDGDAAVLMAHKMVYRVLYWMMRAGLMDRVLEEWDREGRPTTP